MKKRIFILIGIIVIPLLGYSQTVFYNTGNVHVKGVNDNKTTLYIKGDLVAGNQTATPGCDIKVNGGKIVLTGNLRHNAVNNPTGLHVFSRGTGGKLELRAAGVQRIFSDGATYAAIPSKRLDYIIFPDTLEINNQSAVAANTKVIMDARIAGNANRVRLTRGVFVLDSEVADVNKDYPSPTTPPTYVDNTIKQTYNTILAHLRINDAVYDTRMTNPASTVDPVNYYTVGRFQVNFVAPANELGPSYTSSTPYKRIYGMGSPYQELRADYFMFNTLIMPGPGGFLGAGATIIDPTILLQTGRGFVIGVDLRGSSSSDYPDINSANPGIDFATRNTTGYAFNRFLFNNANNMFREFNTDAIKKATYQAEKLVTATSPAITVQLEKGYNYLANPFMAPLSVKALVTEKRGNITVSGWNIKPGDASDGTYVGPRDIMNRVWVLSPNAEAYDVLSSTGSTISYYHSYFSIKPVGGTYTDDTTPLIYEDETNDEGFLISPLQLFRVYSYNTSPTPMTIPYSAVQHGTTRFIRSSEPELKRYDDFVFEVLDEGTKTADRVCVVLRNPSELRATLRSSEPDVFSYKTTAVEVGVNGQVLRRSESLPARANRSLLYLKNDTGDAVDEKMISTATAYEDLFLTPALVPQTVYIRGLRMNTRHNINQVWLLDKQTGSKTSLIEPGSYYQTTTQPDDVEDRFQLVFSMTTEMPDDIQTPVQQLTAWYSDGILTVKTFDDATMGSLISLCDVQGRIIRQATANEPVMKIAQRLETGVYAVKVTGKNPFVIKILVK
ncbi:MAG: hypothetical protein LBD45_07440 [Bacteroidales bacterium]|nr:hypothetical protein [Bacteroidales bacterium]